MSREENGGGNLHNLAHLPGGVRSRYPSKPTGNWWWRRPAVAVCSNIQGGRRPLPPAEYQKMEKFKIEPQEDGSLIVTLKSSHRARTYPLGARRKRPHRSALPGRPAPESSRSRDEDLAAKLRLACFVESPPKGVGFLSDGVFVNAK